MILLEDIGDTWVSDDQDVLGRVIDLVNDFGHEFDPVSIQDKTI